jgi:ATP-dependent DNA helicase RecG
MGLFPGRVGVYRGQLQLVHPEVHWEDGAADQDPRFEGRLIPIYPAVAGLQSPALRRAVQVALGALDDDAPSDPVPARVLEERGLPSLGRAFWQIHTPAEARDWARARARFRFEEAFVLQTALARRRARARAAGAAAPRPARRGVGSLVAALDRRLPFELTGPQRAVGDKLSALLAKSAPMNQLLQGDVGSGKTVVALRAMLQVVESGGQAALLAPTEVLAAQHHRTILELLGPLARAESPGQDSTLFDVSGTGAGEEGVEAEPDGGPGTDGPAEEVSPVTVRLLTGSLTAKAKAAALDDLRSGRAGLVVGTHALLQDAVQFEDLGLVVVDEQHRFGVEQRDVLRSRGERVPHLLVMTATPIPRTVAMTVFGDLGVTVLDGSPPGRQPVATTWVDPRVHPAWLPRVWERVAEEVAAGRRAFVVCPAIEPGEVESGTELVEEPDAALGQLAFPGLESPAPPASLASPGGAEAAGRPPKRPLASVSQVLEQLRAEPALRGLELAPMHGRMSAAEKDRTMAAFSRGDVDVLVATTVIEVGIDVPDATALVVLDSDRFGLSQLHQLRGRVGRGTDPAVCLLVSEAEPESTAAVRLRAMERTTDGFELAEVDLETRREGQILGESQSGSSSLRLVRLTKDGDVIADARRAAEALISEDPDLAQHPALVTAIDRLVAGREDFLERG